MRTARCGSPAHSDGSGTCARISAKGATRLAQALAAVEARDETRARALAAAGEIAAWAGDLEAARPLIEEAVALWRVQGQTQEIACALIELGWGCFNAGDADARRLMEEGFSLQQSVGDPLLVNRARIGLLQVLVSLGELEIVEPMAREALALAERSGDPRSEHFAHHFLADCPLIRGDCAGALPRYRRALELAVELGDRSETAVEIQGVAMALAGCGHPARALRLGGAAAAEFEALAIDLSGSSSGAPCLSATWDALVPSLPKTRLPPHGRKGGASDSSTRLRSHWMRAGPVLSVTCDVRSPHHPEGRVGQAAAANCGHWRYKGRFLLWD